MRDIKLKAKLLGRGGNMISTLTIRDQDIGFGSFMLKASKRMRFEASDIESIEIEGQEQLSRRITATRLLTLGIFAFAARKKIHDKLSYLTINTAEGCAIFEIKDISPAELQAKIMDSHYRKLLK